MIKIRQSVKEALRRRSPLFQAMTWAYNYIPFRNTFHGFYGNTVNICCALLRKTKIKISGQGNVIMLKHGVRLTNCNICVAGNGNKVFIGEYCDLNHGEIWIEDDNNEVLIGNNTSFAGDTHIACIEGTKVDIGQDCMFSANIMVRTGDSHSIMDSAGQRINQSKTVTIGNHVWVGNRAILLKGAMVQDCSIVASGAIVTKPFDETNVILAGNPAKIVKKEIDWDRRRV